MTNHSQYLTFGVGGDSFALPIERAHEVLELQPFSRLPNAPGYVRGLVDRRGQCLLVLDLGVMFGAPAKAATERTRIVVVEANVEGKRVGLGLLVDRVFAVTNFEGRELAPAPSVGDRWCADFVVGVGREAGRLVLALDLDRLLEEEPSAGRAYAA